MKRQLTQILGLQGVIVKSKKNIEKALVLEVESQSKTPACPICNKPTHRLHQNHWHLIKDLPWGETEILLKINRRQFKCNHCQKPFSEELNWFFRTYYAKLLVNNLTNSETNEETANSTSWFAMRYSQIEEKP